MRGDPPTWWPESVTTENYGQLFTQLDFPTYFTNSAIVAIAVAAGNMVFCSMLGYALAKLDFPGKKVRLRAGARHADGAGRGDLHPAVRADHQHRARQLAARHDPAVPGRPVRGLPDAAVHPRPARRADPGRPGRRRRRAADLLLGDPAAVRPGPGHPRRARPSSRRGTTSSGRWSSPRRRTSTRSRSRSRSTPSARTPPSTACCSPARSWSCCPCSSSSSVLQRRIMQGIAMTGIK